MKKAILLAAIFLGSFAVEAQELKWETDINKATAVSNKTKKPILLKYIYFVFRIPSATASQAAGPPATYPVLPIPVKLGFPSFFLAVAK